MSFGIGIGDFVKVVDLATKLVARCKASVTEFKDLSRDVRSMHIVLSAIQTHWEELKRHGRDMAGSYREQLEELTNSCEDVLAEIETLLNKHEGLGAGAGLFNRLRWLTKEIGPLRMRLLTRTMYLSSFNSAVTASLPDMCGQAKSQAEVLKTLNVIYYGYQTGKRNAPAFSQTTVQALDEENDAIWQDIGDELKKEGVDQTLLIAEKPFIKNWIDEVILANGRDSPDQDGPVEDASDRSSFSVPTSPATEPSQTEGTFNYGRTSTSRWNPGDLSRAQTMVEALPQLTLQTSQPVRARRQSRRV